MHYGMSNGTPADSEAIATHLLEHHPERRFKIFEPGEAWEVPED
jgi:hypothetical protein